MSIVLLVIKINQSPFDYLKKNTDTSKVISVNELLYQTKISNKEYAIFYINDKNSLSCAIIKKYLLKYQILKISSEVLISNANKNADFLFSSYNNGQNWIDWGIIRNDSINEVLVNNRKSNIIKVDKYNFRIYYFLGDNTDKIIPPEHKLIER